MGLQVYMYAEAHSSTSIQRNTVLSNLINFHFPRDNPRICIEQATSINEIVDIPNFRLRFPIIFPSVMFCVTFFQIFPFCSNPPREALY